MERCYSFKGRIATFLCFQTSLTDPCNENQLAALFILNLFRQSISTCFGHICSPSSGGIYIYLPTVVYVCVYIYTHYMYVYIYIYIYIHTQQLVRVEVKRRFFSAQHVPNFLYTGCFRRNRKYTYFRRWQYGLFPVNKFI